MKPSPKPIRSSWYFEKMRQAVDLPEVSSTIECQQCYGRGWYVDGETDKPQQVQCAACYGTGRVAKPELQEGRSSLPPSDRE